MNRTEIRELYESPSAFAGAELTVCGWLRSLRDSKTVAFASLSDGSAFKGLQVVLEEGKTEDFQALRKLGVGTAISVQGALLLTPEASQPFELHAREITVEGACGPEYPLQKKRHSLEFLREIGHLRPRTNTIGAALRVRSAAAFAIHRFFQERGFVYAHTPIITCADAEGAGEMFRVTALDPVAPPLNPGIWWGIMLPTPIMTPWDSSSLLTVTFVPFSVTPMSCRAFSSL